MDNLVCREINVTDFIDALEHDGASVITGQGASTLLAKRVFQQVTEHPPAVLVNEGNREIIRDYIASMGLSELIADYSDSELNALFLQIVELDYRELCDRCLGYSSDSSDSSDSSECTCSGRPFICDIKGDENYGQWFYYAGE